MNGFLIAGTASGVGKTTVTLAIIAALCRRGAVVQPFKGGPDFLDTSHHTRIAGRSARNLDTWMLSAGANADVFRGASAGADTVVVEGMMGLFDGKDGATETGSSAEIAKLLRLPVVLVLDAAKSARSVAAVVLGFERFDPVLRLAGVVLNRAASERHFRMLETAITQSCKTPVLGWLPRDPGIAIPERHLGLRTAEEFGDPAQTAHQMQTLAELAEAHLNVDALALLRCGFEFGGAPFAPVQPERPGIRIGVARDRAFTFYYEDNLDLLRQQGAEIVPFSPLHDAAVPDGLDALYLGGGYPELYAAQLSGNVTMRESVRAFAASQRPVYAECGGMMYLAQDLATTNGTHAMAGALPLSIEMTGKLRKFGYVTVELTRDCLLGPAGTLLRGHSFHYSRIIAEPSLPTSYGVTYSLSGRQEAEGFSVGNVLASYVHLHFRTSPHIAAYFVQVASAVKARNSNALSMHRQGV